MTPQDAKRAIASGASGVMISNHGGRQLDGAPAPVDLLREEFERTLPLAGVHDVAGLARRHVRRVRP